MELDDLKKSWNALDEHLKNKEFIEEKEIAQLLGRARNKMNSIDRFNRKLRFANYTFPNAQRHPESPSCTTYARCPVGERSEEL